MEKRKKLLNTFGIILLFLLPAFLFQWAYQSEILSDIVKAVQSHIALYLFILTLLKGFSIVYPPMPGVVFTIASIPLVGWKLAYSADILGSYFGATVSYFLGKKYGYTILEKVIGSALADKIISIKLKQKNQVEAAIFLRFAAGGLISDGLAWGASLIGFKYMSFITGYLVSHILTTLPVFYLISISISYQSWAIGGVGVVFAWLILYRFKGRYFE
ncbi:MAG: hypothetical protein NUV65_02415 [Candidatus Roizmanbacteria bacterium]|nr:hypothetical protein [Candidatus Roizmanbacteria bacterium]